MTLFPCPFALPCVCFTNSPSAQTDQIPSLQDERGVRRDARLGRQSGHSFGAERQRERDVSHRHWEQLTTRIQNLTKLLVSWCCALVSEVVPLYCVENQFVAGMLDCGLMQSSPHSPGGGCSQLEQEFSMDWGVNGTLRAGSNGETRYG